MPARPFEVSVAITGVRETLQAIRQLGPDANKAIRDRSMELSQRMAGRLRSAAQAEGRQAARLAETVKPKRDRVPAVNIGGTKRIFRGRKDGTGREAFRGLFGSEFGARGHGFKPHRGRNGYWVWPTILSEQPAIAQEWQKAADEVVRQFGSRT